MSFDPYELDRSYAGGGETIGQYTAKTFLWMVLGLLVTFAVAIVCWLTNLTIYALVYVPFIHLIVLVATLVLAFTMAGRIERMGVGTAKAMFLTYAALFGFTMSIYLYLFEFTSLILVFAATAVYFGALAAYGHFTKADLAGLRPILMVVFGVLSLFLPLAAFDRIVCLIGIAVFLGFTAYDTQKIRSFYVYYAADPEMLSKASIFSALQLYLDFINLFLYLLRFLGKQRN